MASGFKIADAYVSARLDRDQLRSDISSLPADIDSDVDRAGKDVGNRLGKGISDGADGKTIGKNVADDVDKELQPRAGKSGTDAGDKVSKGMDKALKDAVPKMATQFGTDFSNAATNSTANVSPLIVAGIAGGLIAGAPAILGAAGAMFIGVAAAAVHSNADVQAAFAQTKTAITSTFTDAAQVTVPFFVAALGRIGSAVQAMGPQLHAAFASLSGPIDTMTTGLISMANNALPGIVSAVRAAGPVFQGLASLMGSIGTGIGQMFQILSDHAAASGTVLSSLGSALGAILPILGQLVGVGAELGAQILPPIASALHVVADVLNLVAPVLPVVAAGFLAFKGAQMASGYLDGFAQKLAFASYSSSGFADAAGKASTVVSGISSALPIIGVAVAGLSSAMQAGTDQIDSWGKSLLDGGSAADRAAAQMQHIDSVTQAGLGGLHSWSDVWDRMKALTEGTTDATAKATKAAQDYYNSLSPIGQKQQDVTKAQNDLNDAVARWGPNSGQAAGASAELKDKQDALTQAQNDLMQATHGVTQAMIDEANEALAAADSQFAYQRDVLATKDAQIALTDAIKKNGAGSEEAQKASIAFNQALLQQAEAAGKAAADASGLTDKTDLAKVSQQATLQSLLDLKAQYGTAFPAALDQTIKKLQDAGVKLDDVGAKKPTPTLDANPAPLNAKIMTAQGDLKTLGDQKPQPQITLLNGMFNSQYQQGLQNLAILNSQRPSPVANITTGPFQAAAGFMSGTVSWLNGLRAYPWATLVPNTANAENAINYAARTRTAVINVLQRIAPLGAFMATGGQVGAVVGAAAKRFDVGGKISGPGGGTDDLIPAITNTGEMLRVSNDEWIIPERPSNLYGPAKMAALVAGTAQVLLPSPSRALAGGGTAGSAATTSGVTSGATSGGDTHITVNVNIPTGTAVITDRDIPRTVTAAIEQALVKRRQERS